MTTSSPSLDAPNEPERPVRERSHPARVAIEAARLLLVGAVVSVFSGIVRGIPDLEVLRAGEPAACAPPVAERPSVRWIDQGDASTLVGDTGVAFVDARSRAEFEAGHVAGALHLPMDTGALDEHAAADAVRGAEVIIAYCDTRGDCASSRRLANLLAASGVGDVRVLRGGMPEWLENGHPAEAGPCRLCP